MSDLPEWALRFGPFLSVFAIMAVGEALLGLRPLRVSKGYRWANNIGLVVLDTLFVRILFPMGAVGVAHWVHQNQWGLINSLGWEGPLVVAGSVIFLDLAIYWQHRVFHLVPFLWRFHRVHHADTDFDVSTALRFHPLEILMSMGIKATLVIVVGPPALAVLIFEVVLNAMAMFNHANLSIPMDSWIRKFVVTPDFHRVHHSWVAKETNSNFGFNLSCWDRWFGSYQAQPRQGHLGSTIGLETFRDLKDQRLDRLLMIPFLRG